MWRMPRPIVRSNRSNVIRRRLVERCNEMQAELDDARSQLVRYGDESDEYRKDYEALEAAARRLKSDLLRAHSDAQHNKRIAQEREEQAAERARIEVAESMMRVSDEFAEAIELARKHQMDAKWLEGFVSMYDKINKGLEDVGYRRFESLGEEMDPQRHDALATMPTSDDRAGKVVQVIEAGYEDVKTSKVVRVAKVLVGKPADESATDR